MIISILNQKGGVGKTTLAVNLARAYTLNNKKTLLVDSDTQGSAMSWHERSGGDLLDLTCLPANTLDKDVAKFAPLYERIIIDGVPRLAPITIAAIKAADLVLIPVQPSPYDIWASEDLVRHVKDRIEITEGKLKCAFIISRVITGTTIGKEIYKYLDIYELPILESTTYQRIIYATSVDSATTVMDSGTKAKDEINNLMNEIEVKYGTN